jgi:two-component system chemotaxis response regulator CheB
MPPIPQSRVEVVAIGASTGGPQALQEVLAALPAHFGSSVLIVQHIAPGFVEGLVEWLRPQCAIPIQVAAAGTRLAGRSIYVAPSGCHLVVRGRSIAFTDDGPVSGHRPSATVLFQSVSREYRQSAVGVLLTGMGDDGAIGLRDMKRSGGITVAQDEASSVVFGMPSVAIGLGAADYVLPPPAIGRLLVELATVEPRA